MGRRRTVGLFGGAGEGKRRARARRQSWGRRSRDMQQHGPALISGFTDLKMWVRAGATGLSRCGGGSDVCTGRGGVGMQVGAVAARAARVCGYTGWRRLRHRRLGTAAQCERRRMFSAASRLGGAGLLEAVAVVPKWSGQLG